MKVLLFSDQEIWEILKLLAALLHIGNIKYKAAIIGYYYSILFYLLMCNTLIFLLLDNLDATEIPERTNVTRVANLIGVPVQSLIDALTRKTIFAHGETVVCIFYFFSCT